MTTASIRYVHAGDLTTNQVHELAWNVGAIGDRYQEIAIVGDKVIGSWTYGIEWKRGKAHIDSGHTEVAHRYRRKGIARALWFHGIARWKPTYIESIIGTDEGRDFLAKMIAELAYRSPGTHLSVRTRTEDNDAWESRCNWAAHELLVKLGQKQVAAPAPLKLLKGTAA